MATKIRTTVSLESELYKYGNSVSKKFFQDNFSMFLGYLISLYKEGLLVSHTNQSPPVCQDLKSQVQEHPPVHEINEIDTDVLDSILEGVDNYFNT